MTIENEISDIQETKSGNVEITFCDANAEDFMKITISRKSAWDINKFCRDHLSYAADLKKQGVKTTLQKARENPNREFNIVLKKVKKTLSLEEQENCLEYCDSQPMSDAIWYKKELSILTGIDWKKGCYILNGKSETYYIFSDTGKYVGKSHHKMFIPQSLKDIQL